MSTFGKYGIDSGDGLFGFLSDAGIAIDHTTGIESSENIIYLPDKSTFNWKSANGVVRLNTREAAMYVVEQKTNLKHIPNGKGDPTRPFSFVIETFSDFLDVVYALKTMQVY